MCLLFWGFLPLSRRAWRSCTLLVGGGLVWSAERLFSVQCCPLPQVGPWAPFVQWLSGLVNWESDYLFSVQCCSPLLQVGPSAPFIQWPSGLAVPLSSVATSHSSRKLWYKEWAFIGWWFLSAGWMVLLWTTRWWKRLYCLFVWVGAGNHDPSVSCFGHVFDRKQLVAAVEHSLHFLPKPTAIFHRQAL